MESARDAAVYPGTSFNRCGDVINRDTPEAPIVISLPSESQTLIPSSAPLPEERNAMCDEYEDERMRAFWRRLEQIDAQKLPVLEPEDVAQPLIRIEPASTEPAKARPRALTR
jgi:hypothetical protein